MSSLMQHRGTIKNGKVEILIYLVHDEYIYKDTVFTGMGCWGDYCSLLKLPKDSEPIELEWNGTKHIVPKLYRIWRKPVDMFGCWVRFRINGKLSAPDLSCPESFHQLPRDAEPLTDQDAIAYWSH